MNNQQQAPQQVQQLPGRPGKPEKPPGKKQKGPEAMRGAVRPQKPKKIPILRVTVWPEAGSHWVEDVKVQDGGWFNITRGEAPYRIKPGTVSYHDGAYRGTVYVGHFETIDVRDMTVGMNPVVMDDLGEARVLSELANATKRKMSTWQKIGAAGVTLLFLIGIGVVIWAKVSLSGDFHGLEEAFRQGANAAAGSGGGAGGGHQAIAPGGN